MELKSLIVDSKTTWVEFPGLDGFEVELANLSRKELVNLRKRCTQNKFNRKIEFISFKFHRREFNNCSLSPSTHSGLSLGITRSPVLSSARSAGVLLALCSRAG